MRFNEFSKTRHIARQLRDTQKPVFTDSGYLKNPIKLNITDYTKGQLRKKEGVTKW